MPIRDATLASLKSYHAAEDQRLRRDIALLCERRPDLVERLHLMR